jgi:cysteine desulfurase
MEHLSIYFDHCGSTPMGHASKAVMLDLLSNQAFGNSMATHHALGLAASDIVEKSRTEIAQLLQCREENIHFFSGASEANNFIVFSFWNRFKDRGCRIFYSAIEHKSILEPCLLLASFAGVESKSIGVDKSGHLLLDVLEAELSNNPNRTPTLVCVMHTNNEVPARQSISEIQALCKRHKAYFHCDAVQGIVRESLQVSSETFGSCVISPHKFYGPKGVGILCTTNSSTSPLLAPLYRGGDQESGFRPGTLNTPAIGASSVALREHLERLVDLRAHLLSCDKLFVEAMSKRLPGFKLTVPKTTEAPGIINFYIENNDAQSLLLRLKGVCINRGASCTGAGGEKFSHVPRALGLPVEVQANVLRASFGWHCRLEEIEPAVKAIADAVRS